MSSSFNDPLADQRLGPYRVKVYEEQAGELTVSFSASPRMWSSVTMPADAWPLMAEAVSAAVAARSSCGSLERTLIALNAYQGDNIWQDVILGLDEYDEAASDVIDCGQADRFELTDGTEIRFDAQRREWSVA